MSARPVRLQLSRKRGFNLQELSRATNGLEAVNCSRPGSLGNPFVIGEKPDARLIRKWGWSLSPQGREQITRDARHAVLRFRHCLFWDQAIHDYVRKMCGGKNGACYCAPDDFCHVDPLMWVANSTREEVNQLHDAIDQSIMAEADALFKADMLRERVH